MSAFNLFSWFDLLFNLFSSSKHRPRRRRRR
jgi:hypothetical protein